MTSFIEKLVNNELPTSGLKPNFSEKELLRPQKEELRAPDTELGPTIRGFYQIDWVHGDTSKDDRKNYFLEIAQRFKIGKFFWEPQFVFQSGRNSIYSSSIGLELGNLGEVQVTRRTGLTEVSHYFSTHKNNDLKNGLNSRVALSFKNLQSRPNLRLSSAYTHTLDVLDRKENKLTTKTSLYGVDTSLAFPPFQQTSYSLYYQLKTSNYDFITAFLRKSADDSSNYYSNNFVTGIKYKLSENMKLLAKASYNVEDRHPRLDLMLKNTNSQDSTLKTFHGISTDLKATSGFIFGTKKFRLQGLARVNFGNNDPKSQPFSLSLKLEANDQTTYSFTINDQDQKVASPPSKCIGSVFISMFYASWLISEDFLLGIID